MLSNISVNLNYQRWQLSDYNCHEQQQKQKKEEKDDLVLFCCFNFIIKWMTKFNDNVQSEREKFW